MGVLAVGVQHQGEGCVQAHLPPRNSAMIFPSGREHHSPLVEYEYLSTTASTGYSRYRYRSRGRSIKQKLEGICLIRRLCYQRTINIPFA